LSRAELSQMNTDITHDTTSQDEGFLNVEKQKGVQSRSLNSISIFLDR